MVEPRVLGQLLLMQSLVVGLPDEKAIFSFVCRGLLDVPGVAAVRFAERAREPDDPAAVSIPLVVGETCRGALLFTVSDPEALAPYLDYLKNFCFMLAVILEERSQRHQNEMFRSQLEERVMERTKQLLKVIADKQAAEKSLREGERFNTDLIDKMNEAQRVAMVGSWEWDLRTNHVWWSEETYRIFGVSPRDYVPSFDGNGAFIHPDDRASYETTFAHSLKTGEPLDIDLRLVTGDGRVKRCNVKGKLVQDGDGSPARFVGTVMDITERKRTEEEHLSHLAFLESLEVVDRTIRTADGLESMMTAVLDAALSIFACDRAWLIYPCDPESVSWSVRIEQTRPEYPGALAAGRELPMTPEVRGTFQELLRTAGPVVYDPKSGRSLPQVSIHFSVQSQIQTAVYPKSGKPWVFGLHQCTHARAWSENDVRLFTEVARRLADGLSSLLFMKELSNSEVQLRSLVQTIPDLIWLKDPDGVYLDCNTIFERFFGAGKKQIVGKTDYDFVDRELADFFREHDRKAMAAGGPSVNEEWVTFADDGHRALLETIKTPMFDAGGRLVGVLGIARDITERIRATEEKARLEDQLRQSQKVEAIGRLAGGVAHDFNNILSAVIGFAGILQMKIAEGDPLRHYADEVIEAGERGADLTRQILAFSRKQVVNLKPVRLNDVVRGLEKMLRRLLPESIDIVHDLSGEELAIFADTGQLGQVLINLVTNARDAIVGSGKISIATGRSALDRQFVESHGDGEPGEYAVLTVSDTGRGMDEATRARIFEPFFTTKEPGKGTGLGMSVAHGIVKQHRGLINVYSAVGRGTVVRIYLPLTVGAGTQELTAPAETQVVGGSETILVAEDDAALRKLSRAVLSQHGFTVIDAEDGEDAVAKFIAHRDAIRLIILDGLMPKMGGVEALEEIRRLCPGVKALFMSGYDDDLFSSASLRDKAAFIQKPVMPTDLLRKVREVLDG